MDTRFYKLESKKDLLGKISSFFPSSNIFIEITLNEEELIITKGKDTFQYFLSSIQIFINNQLLKKVEELDETKQIILKFINNEKELLIESTSFELNLFFEFLILLKELYEEYNQTFEEKLRKVNLKCQKSLKDDRELEEELIQNMGEIYQSVYQVYNLNKHLSIRELQNNANVAFYYLTKHGYYVYFMRNHYKMGISNHHIKVSENLLNTVMQNLNVVHSRMESYRNVQEQLITVRKEHQQKQELAKVARNLASLQVRNMQGGDGNKNLGFDTEVLTQLENLTETISSVQTEEQSLILKEHISLFEEHSLTHQQIVNLKSQLNK